MQIKDLLLILSVIIIWGINFTVIRIGLNYAEPFLLGALRFIPFIFIFFLFKRPAIPNKILIAYGLLFCFGQFALLFLGIALGMPAGMASMILQSQAFFTVVFACFSLGESLRLRSIFGLIIASLGLVIICTQNDTNLTLIGLLLTLGAGACWGCGNILLKKYSHANMVDLTVWSALVPIIPFFICAWLLEGSDSIIKTFQIIDGLFILAILYIALLSTLYGCSIWGKMIRKYQVANIAPFSLLVPIVGMSAAAYLLDEHLSMLDIIGAIIVMGGLAINIFGEKLLILIRIKLLNKLT